MNTNSSNNFVTYYSNPFVTYLGGLIPDLRVPWEVPDLVWPDISTAPRDGTIILGLFEDGQKRLTKYISTPNYEGWDTGYLIEPIRWKAVNNDDIL